MGLMEREMVDRLGMVGQMGILELASFQLFPLGNVTSNVTKCTIYTKFLECLKCNVVCFGPGC